MGQEKIQRLVLGCGVRGYHWASRQPDSQKYVCLDLQQSLPFGSLFIQGSAFDLPIKDASVTKIYADFVVNNVICREPGIDKVRENPGILDSEDFPPMVRRWFTEVLGKSHIMAQKHITEIQWLLRRVALREMWRVTAPSGGIEVLDFDYNTNWILHFAPDILNTNPGLVKLDSMPIVRDDWERSGSLHKVHKGPTRVRKIKICKLPPYQSQFAI